MYIQHNTSILRTKLTSEVRKTRNKCFISILFRLSIQGREEGWSLYQLGQEAGYTQDRPHRASLYNWSILYFWEPKTDYSHTPLFASLYLGISHEYPLLQPGLTAANCCTLALTGCGKALVDMLSFMVVEAVKWTLQKDIVQLTCTMSGSKPKSLTSPLGGAS